MRYHWPYTQGKSYTILRKTCDCEQNERSKAKHCTNEEVSVPTLVRNRPDLTMLSIQGSTHLPCSSRSADPLFRTFWNDIIRFRPWLELLTRFVCRSMPSDIVAKIYAAPCPSEKSLGIITCHRNSRLFNHLRPHRLSPQC